MTAAQKLPTEGDVVEAFKPYEGFCRSMLDAYAVVDAQGKIVKLNQLLCQLVGLKSKQILKAESFDHCIGLYINDKKIGVQELIDTDVPTRMDEVRGHIAGEANLNLILGVHPFKNEDGSPQGAFILIRDVTAETNLQGKYKAAANKSITDPLTGLYTRNYFEDYLKLQTKNLSDLPEDSENRSLSIIMVDIDFFKKVNDVHGHQAGDYILKEVGRVMKQTFRKTDVVCRYGGEEFMVILPVTDLTGTGQAAEKLREAIESEKIVFEGTHIPITISSGVAQFNVDGEDYPATIARADAALYQAKKDGRNRVCIST